MSVFNVIITRTFYQVTIPGEMLEAAKVDGASDFRFFLASCCRCRSRSSR